MEFNTKYEVMPGEIREAFDALETLKGLRSTKEKSPYWRRTGAIPSCRRSYGMHSIHSDSIM